MNSIPIIVLALFVIPLGLDAQQINHSPDSITYQFNKETFIESGQSQNFKLKITTAGRYRVTLIRSNATKSSVAWVEDYVNNPDDRTYNITGDLKFSNEQTQQHVDGSPLNIGEHEMKLHTSKGKLWVKAISFVLIKPHQNTPKSLIQNMIGTEWKLVWNDEFNDSGLPDSSKWDYNIGNWGWGNNELQYYTQKETKNARVKNGSLIIEAHPDTDGSWTSARLTTQSKVSFTYGKIEFRAKVPAARGTWSAGWFLGDAYVDEVSWPYCGEIDVLECVGFEINDTTGSGLNHATCHTRSYYFKQGNQIGSQIKVNQMNTQFHTFSIEWYPHKIEAFVDGVHYYTYDKNANELEWPFNHPQNIILNLAIGGGWGGAKGLAPNLPPQQYIIDYVRVYELTNPK